MTLSRIFVADVLYSLFLITEGLVSALKDFINIEVVFMKLKMFSLAFLFLKKEVEIVLQFMTLDLFQL